MNQTVVPHFQLYKYTDTAPIGLAVLIPMAKVLGVTASSLIGEDRRSTPASRPIGRARMAFEAVSRLPKRQQQKIVEVVEAFVAQQINAQRQSA